MGVMEEKSKRAIHIGEMIEGMEEKKAGLVLNRLISRRQE
jgi:hypothetical protein